jgi:hypothetical protein
MTIGKLCLEPFAVIVTVPVPGLVVGPIFQVQAQTPFPSAVSETNPCAVLLVPAGVTWPMEQAAPAAVWIVAEAFPPRATGEVS